MLLDALRNTSRSTMPDDSIPRHRDEKGAIIGGRWKSKVTVGMFSKSGEFHSTVIDRYNLFSGIKSYCERFSEGDEEFLREHLFEDGWAIPITWYHGLVVFVLREGEYVSLVTDLDQIVAKDPKKSNYELKALSEARDKFVKIVNSYREEADQTKHGSSTYSKGVEDDI